MTTTVKVHVNGDYRADIFQDNKDPVAVNPQEEKSFYLPHPCRSTFFIEETYLGEGGGQPTPKEIGEAVTYVDPVGNRRAAIVTAVWSAICINVAFVNDDENQKDNYGRKIERATSVMKRMEGSAHGNFWF